MPKWSLYVLILVALTAGGYVLFAGQPATSLETPFNQTQTPDQSGQAAFCTGKFIDTHLHWDDIDVIEKVVPQMQTHQVGCAIGFIGMDIANLDEAVEILEDDFPDFNRSIIPFFHINPQTPEDISVSNLNRVLDRVPNFFQGFGEVAFYRPPFINTSLTSDNWSQVFDHLADQNLWLMIHLRPDQIGELETMLSDHPGTKVLLHGFEFPQDLPRLLSQYQNLYFTLDTASLIQLPGNPPQILMYPPDLKNHNFAQAVSENQAQILRSARQTWLPVIQAAPDRVMWGSDVSLDWHAEAAVYSTLIDFSVAFTQSLPGNLQDLYAYQNAYNLFITPSVNPEE